MKNIYIYSLCLALLFGYSGKAQEIFVQSLSSNSIQVFNYDDAGDISPKRVIAGSNTGLLGPLNLAAYNHQLYVCCINAPSIRVFNQNDYGDVSPQRLIAGTSTGIEGQSNLVCDENYIYVTGFSNFSVRVFNRTENGNVSPLRVIAGDATGIMYPMAVAVDENFIYVANYYNKVLVFKLSDDGNVAPQRVIYGPNTGLNALTGISVDTNRIYVSNNGSSSLLIFPLDADGDTSPQNVLAGINTGFSGINNSVIANSLIYLAIANNKSVRVFNTSDYGDVSPLRVISGSSTLLNGCNSIAFMPLQIPVLTTTPVSGIGTTAAFSGGTITSEGASSVTARGVVWSTSTAPELTINETGHTADGSGTGSFASNLTGLIPGTKYYIRAYATNSETTAYGDELNFTTGETIFVDISKTSGSNNGTSWTDAYLSLQSALDAASDGVQIWVAAGTYKPEKEVGGSGDRFKAFQLKNGVEIYGGLAGIENPETFDLNDRDFATYETILSGDHNGDDNFSIMDYGYQGTTGEDNSFHVMNNDGSVIPLNNTAVLDGFTIMGGHANGEDIHNDGGGILNNINCSPTLRNLIIVSNAAGFGGGINCQSGSDPQISNAVIEYNYADEGGGLYNDDSSPQYSFVNLRSNIAGYGAGLFNENQSAPAFVNCTIQYNQALTSGGGILNDDFSKTDMKNCLIVRNAATSGAAFVSNYADESTLVNCTFSQNEASDAGGGIASVGSNITLNNCIVWFNSGNLTGNNFYLTDNAAITVNYSCLSDDYVNDIYIDNSTFTATIQNIHTDPVFVDVGNDDFRLYYSSACLDAGNNSFINLDTDIRGAGYGRKLNKDDATEGISDMGAYEYLPGTDPRRTLFFVKHDATGNNDGTSWNDAFIQLQPAILAADSDDIVWVAAGTYRPTAEVGGSGYRHRSFQMKEGVEIYGGFAGNENPDSFNVNDRNLLSNETILSGDIYNFGAPLHYSYHVFYHPEGLGLTGAAILDGFTVSEGNANETGQHESVGGAFYNLYNYPTIRNCIIKNNYAMIAGGGIFNSHAGAIRIINCLFYNNEAGSLGGGAVYNYQGSHAFMISCTFSKNTSGVLGGAILNSDASPLLSNSILWGNTADFDGDQIATMSGTQFLQNCYLTSTGFGNTVGTISATNCVFKPDPKFVDYYGNDFRLIGTSPCVDKGNDGYNDLETDIRGAGFGRRLNQVDGGAGTMDIGAYEYKFGNDPPKVTIYCKHDAAGTQDGSSWTNAYTSFQDALWGAVPGDQIWVAAGTYYPSSEHSLEAISRNYHFEMVDGVEIYGGFSGTENPGIFDLADRDFIANETILSGDLSGNDDFDVENGGYQGTTGEDNTYHVIFNPDGLYLSNAAVLDGFTIKGGNANGTTPDQLCGGGILNYSNNSPVFKNLKIRNNVADFGGGLYNDFSNLISVNCLIDNNLAFATGGGILEKSSSTYTNATIAHNYSIGVGGGIFIDASMPAFQNSIIWGNMADYGANQIYINAVENWLWDDILQENVLMGVDGGINLNHTCYKNGLNDNDFMVGEVNEIDCLNSDPLFINATVGDFRLDEASPCLDAGENAFNTEPVDIRGKGFGRKLNKADGTPGTIDMGAYEFLAGACANPTAGGEIEAAQVICSGIIPAEITNKILPTGHAGTLEYQWQINTGTPVENWENTGSVTASPSYQPAALTQTTWFRRLARVTCQPDWSGAVSSDTVKITVISTPVSVAPASGTGSESDPYLITSFENLQWITDDWNRWNLHYRQTANINAAITASDCYPADEPGKGWKPIGNWSHLFTGHYDGGDYIIDSLTINRSSETEVGLFGIASGADIENIRLHHVSITGGNYTGGLIGWALDNNTITRCHVSGEVQGGASVGGLAGICSNGSIVAYCYSDASITGVDYTGGFLGHNMITAAGQPLPFVHDCYSRGNVVFNNLQDWRIGGFIGENYNGNVERCYSTGSLTNLAATSPTNKGFIGQVLETGTKANNFWDIQTSLQSTSHPNDGATGQTTGEMNSVLTFLEAGWDFSGETSNGTEDIWNIHSTINSGYPFFNWSGSIIYVDATRPDDSGDGYSWTTAKKTLQAALEISVFNDQIWVAKGTYTPVKDISGNASPADPRTRTFSMKDGVAIYGGFVGNEATHYDLSLRDLIANEAILSGDHIGNDDFDPVDGGFQGTSGDDNSYHVVYNEGSVTPISNAAILDGFTIRGGNANTYDIDNDGGGILNNNNCSPTLRYLKILNNAGIFGGGINCQNGSNPIVDRCIVEYNYAGEGGGLYNDYSSPVYSQLEVRFNEASYGGCLFNENQSAPTFINGSIHDNNASVSGGGILNDDGSKTDMTNCLLYGNTAISGAAFVSNYADNSTLTNCTLANNAAGDAGGGVASVGSVITLNNSIVRFNQGNNVGNDIYLSDAAEITLNYSCYSQNSVYNDNSTFTATNNCDTTNPRFVDFLNDDYRLFGVSPAVNTGNNAYVQTPNPPVLTDIRGENRISHTTVDKGAYEWKAGTDLADSVRLYVTDLGGSSVVEVNPVTGVKTLRVSGLTNPWGLAVSDSGYLFVAANWQQGEIRKYDPDGNPVGTQPFVDATESILDMAIDPTTGYLGVNGYSASQLQPYNPTTGSAAGSLFSIATSIQGIDYDEQGNLYGANNATGNVMKYSPAGIAVANISTSCSGAQDVCISGNDLFVSCNSGVRKFDLSGNPAMEFGSSGVVSVSNPIGIEVIGNILYVCTAASIQTYHATTGVLLNENFSTGFSSNKMAEAFYDKRTPMPEAPVATAATSLLADGFTANWNAADNALKYYLDVANDSTFTSMVSGYADLDVGALNSYPVTGLAVNDTFYYRVRSLNTFGLSANSNVIRVILPMVHFIVNEVYYSSWGEAIDAATTGNYEILQIRNYMHNSASTLTSDITLNLNSCMFGGTASLTIDNSSLIILKDTSATKSGSLNTAVRFGGTNSGLKFLHDITLGNNFSTSTSLYSGVVSIGDGSISTIYTLDESDSQWLKKVSIFSVDNNSILHLKGNDILANTILYLYSGATATLEDGHYSGPVQGYFNSELQIGNTSSVIDTLSGDMTQFFGNVRLTDGSTLKLNLADFSSNSFVTILGGSSSLTKMVKQGNDFTIGNATAPNSISLNPKGLLDLGDDANAGLLSVEGNIFFSNHNDPYVGKIRFRLKENVGVLTMNGIECIYGAVYSDDVDGRLDVSRHLVIDMDSVVGSPGTTYELTIITADYPILLTGAVIPVNVAEGWKDISVTLRGGKSAHSEVIFKGTYDPCSNPTDGGSVASSQTICYNTAPAQFTSISLPSGNSGDLEYQWQKSTDSVNFADVSTATETTYTSGNLTETTWFRRLARVGCMPDWSGAVSSDTLKVTVVEMQRRYVTLTGGATKDGLSWETAYDAAQLQDAIHESCVEEVWVAAGTYNPTYLIGEKAIGFLTFLMKEGVAIYGGFNGTESSIDQRNIKDNPTILSGDLLGNDIYSEPDWQNTGENSPHVIYLPSGLGLTSSAVLDGFIIQGGITGVPGKGYAHNYSGGGLFSENNSPLIQNCIFRNNYGFSGGAVGLSGSSSPVFSNCLIINNIAYNGAGFYASYLSNPTLINITVSNNSAFTAGGGLYIENSAATVNNSIIWANKAEEGKQIYYYLAVKDPTAVVMLNHSCFSNSIVDVFDPYEQIAMNSCIFEDPSFVLEDTSDYRIYGTSTCVDAGNDVYNDLETDIRGAGFNRKISNAKITFTIDMGAYEYNSSQNDPYSPCTAPTTGGEIEADQIICYNMAPASIINKTLPSGHTGILNYKWQNSIVDPSDPDFKETDFSDISNTNTDTYLPGSVSQTTWFRRLARVDCMNDWDGAAKSNIVSISVYDAFDPGTIATDGETICYNGDPGLIGSETGASGGDGTITYAWYKSTNHFVTDSTLIAGATLAAYDPPTGLTDTTSYRRYAKDSECNTNLEPSTGTWTVNPEPVPLTGTLSKTPDAETVCVGEKVSALLIAGSGGNGTDSTSYRTRASSVWSAWTAYTSGSEISTTGKTDVEIRTKRKAAYCTDASWTIVSWVVEPTPVNGNLSKIPDEVLICQGDEVSASLVAGSGGNGIDSLAYRTHDGNTWSEWVKYTSGSNISSDNVIHIEIQTLRLSGYCDLPDADTVRWSADVTPPAVTPNTNISVSLDPTGNYTLLTTDLLQSCTDAGVGIESVDILPRSLTCADLGLKSIVVTVTDDCGNETELNMTITVTQGTGLTPWESCNTHANAVGTSAFTPCNNNGTFYLTSKGKGTSTSDVMHFVYQPLTGNGTIIARLADVKNDGWAGVMMRESCDPGSKLVLFKTRLYNPNVLTGYRKLTDKTIYTVSQVYQQIRWMKIQRNGNTFLVFVSYNGTTWSRAYSTTITMNTTIMAGIFTENNLTGRTTQAWFDHVELANVLKSDYEWYEVNPLNETKSLNIQLYPNPADQQVTVTLTGIDPSETGVTGLTATLISSEGKVMKQFSLQETETLLNLEGIMPGVYMLRFENEETIIIKKLVIQ